MPTSRVYIDSRYRLPGGTDSDFRIALKTPIEVPHGTPGWIDGVCLSNSFGNIAFGRNDRVFVREFVGGSYYDFHFDIPPGEYNGHTLAPILEVAINVLTGLPNNYTVTFASGTLTFSNPTPAATGYSHIITREMIINNSLNPPWGSTTTPAPLPLSTEADASRVLGNLDGVGGPIAHGLQLTTDMIDLMPYRQLFLHSHIGAPTSQGPRGENTIVRRIIVNGEPGSLITDFHNTQLDYITLGEQLSTLHFSLRDIEGHIVDTHGHPISFALYIGQPT